MEILSTLLAPLKAESMIITRFSLKNPIMWSSDVFFVINLIDKQSSCPWFERLWCSCDITVKIHCENEINHFVYEAGIFSENLLYTTYDCWCPGSCKCQITKRNVLTYVDRIHESFSSTCTDFNYLSNLRVKKKIKNVGMFSCFLKTIQQVKSFKTHRNEE